MKTLSTAQFTVIAEVIAYLYSHASQQPSLEEAAAQVGWSSSYLQRQFQAWVGISPKKFIQYISVQHAKALLSQQHSVLETALETGLSGTGRLHDLFVHLEGVSPGEFKQLGHNIEIDYSYEATPFGDIFIASSARGVCSVQFVLNEPESVCPLATLAQQYPYARFQAQSRHWHTQIAQWICGDLSVSLSQKIPLRLRGTPFQLKVWEALLKIPAGQLYSYQQVAEHMGQPSAVRAVASAIAKNPIAYLIPCHRVIRASGVVGEYHWHTSRKLALLSTELAMVR